MRILALADEEYKGLWDYYEAGKTEGVELILSCGDLDPSYLEFLVTMTNRPLCYVRGNHDAKYDRHPPEGCVDIDGRVVEICGLRIGGLGGSMRYRPDAADQYTEAEMRHRIRRLHRMAVRRRGIDILVAHAPARGFGDMEDLPHRGFECFNTFLERWKPALFLHGHVHRSYGSDFRRTLSHPSGTMIVNAYEYYSLELGKQ